MFDLVSKKILSNKINANKNQVAEEWFTSFLFCSKDMQKEKANMPCI